MSAIGTAAASASVVLVSVASLPLLPCTGVLAGFAPRRSVSLSGFVPDRLKRHWLARRHYGDLSCRGGGFRELENGGPFQLPSCPKAWHFCAGLNSRTTHSQRPRAASLFHGTAHLPAIGMSAQEIGFKNLTTCRPPPPLPPGARQRLLSRHTSAGRAVSSQTSTPRLTPVSQANHMLHIHDVAPCSIQQRAAGCCSIAHGYGCHCP